jgi:predicted dehydrogenase
MSAASPTLPLRVGVVGLGYAGTTHALAYLGMPETQLVAMAGKERARLEELGRTHSLEFIADDWEDLVARDDLDVISIATPNALHAPIAIAALEAGKHVFCEKPLATTAAEARAMAAAARANDRVLEVAFNHRRRADVQYLRRYIEEVGLGDIYHVRATWKRRSGIPGLTSWFTSKALAGGGALIDLGPHVLDSVLFLLGEPKVTAASAVTHGVLGRAGYGAMSLQEQMAGGHSGFEVEDLASALLRLDGGASIQFEISWAGHTADDEDISIELLGVDGGARILVKRYASDDTLTIYRDEAGAHTTMHPQVHVDDKGHPAVIREFVDVVLSGDWSAHHGDGAMHRTEVLDACYESARLGREVTI